MEFYRKKVAGVQKGSFAENVYKFNNIELCGGTLLDMLKSLQNSQSSQHF